MVGYLKLRDVLPLENAATNANGKTTMQKQSHSSSKQVPLLTQTNNHKQGRSASEHRRILLWVCLCIACSLCITIPPVQASPKVQKTFKAVQVVLAQKVLIAMEANLQFIRGHNVFGKQLWRTRYQRKAFGIQGLFVFNGKPLLYGGQVAYPLDPKKGKLLSKGQSVPYLSSPGRPGCWLNQIKRICSFNCPCSFRFANCKTGAPIGKTYQFFRMCRYHFSGRGKSCGCWGSNGSTLGRSGALLIAEVEKPQRTLGKRSTYGQLLIGVHATTGKELWRRNAPTFSAATWVNGLSMTQDGSVCWVGDSNGQFEAFACKTGKTLWTRNKKTKGWRKQKVHYIASSGRNNIVVVGKKHASCYDAKTGNRKWRHSTKKQAFALVKKLDNHEKSLQTDKGTLVLLDPTKGKTIATIKINNNKTKIYRLGGKYLLVDGPQLRVFSASGQPIAATKPQGSFQVWASKTMVLAVTGKKTTAFSFPDLHSLGQLSGKFRPVIIEKGLGKHRALLQKGKSFHLVTF